jgi:hypothetical protein
MVESIRQVETRSVGQRQCYRFIECHIPALSPLSLTVFIFMDGCGADVALE